MDNLKVTPKQLEILLLLFRFRFLDRTHIQRFLDHKDPRRINTWLKDLTERNIVGRKYSTKLKDNTQPAVYYLATKSRKILLDEEITSDKLLKRVYREKSRSERLINHCLFLANIYFYLLKQSIRTGDILHFYTKTDLHNHYYLPYNRPDAYIALEESEGQIKRYFLEIVDEGTPRFMLRSKISQYIDYFSEQTWQNKTGHPFPSLLFVCPNETLKSYLHKHIRQVLEEEAEDDISFYLTTVQDLEVSQLQINIWELVEEE